MGRENGERTKRVVVVVVYIRTSKLPYLISPKHIFELWIRTVQTYNILYIYRVVPVFFSSSRAPVDFSTALCTHKYYIFACCRSPRQRSRPARGGWCFWNPSGKVYTIMSCNGYTRVYVELCVLLYIVSSDKCQCACDFFGYCPGPQQ